MTIRTAIIRKSAAPVASIKKSDDELQIVWAEVYAPGVPDSQGDFMTAEQIRNAAYRFMGRGLVQKIDTRHDRQVNGSVVVESFIARPGDETFIPGSWVVGVHIPNPAVWEMVKKGELNGFSFDGAGYREPREIEIEVPETLQGGTDRVENHEHTFMVKFDPVTGEFLGGETNEVAGHKHRIVRGSLTEDALGHAHRFSFVEGFVQAQAA